MINKKDFKEKKEQIFQQELYNLNQIIDMQKKKKEILLNCLNRINLSIQKLDSSYNENDMEHINTAIKLLKSIKQCLDKARDSLSKLDSQKEMLYNLHDLSEIPENSEIDKYNSLSSECQKNIFESSMQIEDFISLYIENSLFLPSTSPNKSSSNEENKNLEDKKNNEEIQENEFKEETFVDEDDDSISDNTVLLISEKEKKVFLPYKVSEVQSKLEHNSNYQSFQEVIDDKYTIPLKKFKNPVISRFSESYNLMKNKENASVFDSLDLALELCFNHSLNPAVITACNSLDELDVYLDCLDSDNLDNFDLFEVKYDLLPTKKRGPNK